MLDLRRHLVCLSSCDVRSLGVRYLLWPLCFVAAQSLFRLFFPPGLILPLLIGRSARSRFALEAKPSLSRFLLLPLSSSAPLAVFSLHAIHEEEALEAAEALVDLRISAQLNSKWEPCGNEKTEHLVSLDARFPAKKWRNHTFSN